MPTPKEIDRVRRLNKTRAVFERDVMSCGVLIREQLVWLPQEEKYQLAQAQAIFVLYCTAVAEGANLVIQSQKKE